MKLQISRLGTEITNGQQCWVDVVEFDADRQREVEDAAASLARASGERWMRIVGDGFETRTLNANGVFRAGGL